MGCSIPDLPVHHQLLELAQTHVHWVGDTIQPSHPLSSPSPPALSLSQHQWVSEVAQSCLTLCDLMDCSLSTRLLPLWDSPGKSTGVGCHLSFQMSQFFASGGQSIGVSASTSVSPVNIQNWFSLGLTGWISLQSKGILRVFFNTTVQKHQFFSTQLSLHATLTAIHDSWKNDSLD